MISFTSLLYSTRTPSAHCWQKDSTSSNVISSIGLVNMTINVFLQRQHPAPLPTAGLLIRLPHLCEDLKWIFQSPVFYPLATGEGGRNGIGLPSRSNATRNWFVKILTNLLPKTQTFLRCFQGNRDREDDPTEETSGIGVPTEKGARGLLDV